MNTRSRCVGLLPAAMMLLVACGSADDSLGQEDSGPVAGSESFDLSQLPADFPRDLIPPDYETANYVELGGVAGATFENTRHVDGWIDHYVGLLGEPTIDVSSDDGQRNVQWHMPPYPMWIVGVLGGANESIASVSRLPQ